MHDFWRGPWLSAFIAAGLAFGVALLIGQDANWDLLNYHLYTPLAWQDGRLGQDIAVAQLQTWHNPLLDVPLAWMVRAGASGWTVTLWLAIPAAIALFAALRLLDTAWPEHRSLLRTALAAIVAAFGAAAWSATGASFNDAYTAAAVIPALWWAVASQGRRSPWATWLPVGLLAGAAAGLKLTSTIYCVGFIAAATVAGPRRELPSRIAALAVGGLCAALLTWGFWGWRLWELHANPLFPYFNQWFHSPDALPLPYKDERFVPQGVWPALRVPLRLLETSRDFSEVKMRDPRVLLGLAALLGWTGALWMRRGAPASETAAASGGDGRRCAAIVLAFVATSYALWVCLYGIYRYLYPLELVFSVAVFGALSAIGSRRWRIALMLLAAVAIVEHTKLPRWPQQRFRDPMVSVRFPPLPADSMVVISSWEPLGHAAIFLPREVPAIAIYNNLMDPAHCTRLQAEAEKRIAAHAGPLFLLRQGAWDAGTEKISSYGLSIRDSCLAVEDDLSPMELCPLTRAAVSPICSAPPTGR